MSNLKYTGTQLPHVLFAASSRGWGLTYYNTILALAIKEAGIPLTVLTTPGEQSPGLHDRLRASGIRLCVHESLEVGNPGAIREASKVIASSCKWGPNLFHCGGVLHGAAAWVAKRHLSADKQLYVTTMLGAMRHRSRVWPLYYFLGSLVLNAVSDRVFLLCSREKTEMVRCGLRSSKAGVVYFFVDDRTFKETPHKDDLAEWVTDARVLDERRPKAIYLAQFHKAKGHSILIKAWKQIVHKHPDLLLVLAGGGEQVDYCKSLAAKLGIAEHVVFLSRLPRDKVPALLHQCTFAVVPSRTETFGSCIAEPLLAGLPVCSSAVGIAEELALIDGVHIVPSVTAEALASELLAFVNNLEQERERMTRGRAWIERECAVRQVVAKLQLEWERLLNAQSPSDKLAEGLLAAAMGSRK